MKPIDESQILTPTLAELESCRREVERLRAERDRLRSCAHGAIMRDYDAACDLLPGSEGNRLAERVRELVANTAGPGAQRVPDSPASSGDVTLSTAQLAGIKNWLCEHCVQQQLAAKEVYIGQREKLIEVLRQQRDDVIENAKRNRELAEEYRENLAYAEQRAAQLAGQPEQTEQQRIAAAWKELVGERERVAKDAADLAKRAGQPEQETWDVEAVCKAIAEEFNRHGDGDYATWVRDKDRRWGRAIRTALSRFAPVAEVAELRQRCEVQSTRIGKLLDENSAVRTRLDDALGGFNQAINERDELRNRCEEAERQLAERVRERLRANRPTLGQLRAAVVAFLEDADPGSTVGLVLKECWAGDTIDSFKLHFATLASGDKQNTAGPVPELDRLREVGAALEAKVVYLQKLLAAKEIHLGERDKLIEELRQQRDDVIENAKRNRELAEEYREKLAAAEQRAMTAEAEATDAELKHEKQLASLRAECNDEAERREVAEQRAAEAERQLAERPDTLEITHGSDGYWLSINGDHCSAMIHLDSKSPIVLTALKRVARELSPTPDPRQAAMEALEKLEAGEGSFADDLAYIAAIRKALEESEEGRGDGK